MQGKPILSVALMLSMMAATAQNKEGEFSLKPMVGITVAELRNVGYVQYGPKVGFSGGLEAEYGITPQLGISLGAIYSQQGGKYDIDVENSITTIIGTYKISEEKTRSKVKVDYINIPLLANFYVWRGMALKAGVQLGILVHDKMNYHYQKIPYIPNDEPYPLEDHSNHTWEKMTDFGKSIDFGIPVGLSYEYRDFIVDARYYFGLTKIDSPNFGCNRGFYLNLGYRIGL